MLLRLRENDVLVDHDEAVRYARESVAEFAVTAALAVHDAIEAEGGGPTAYIADVAAGVIRALAAKWVAP